MANYLWINNVMSGNAVTPGYVWLTGALLGLLSVVIFSWRCI